MNFKFLIILTCFLSISCSGETLPVLKLNEASLIVEVAYTPEERQLGLMNRESLAGDRGMIFIFDRERSVSFWMKNTSIPLSIAYINKDGIIMDIHELTPFSLEPVPSKRSSVLYALEVNSGYFDKNGIVEGYEIDLSPIMDYLKSSN